jgi:hypothetical protein
MRVEGGQPIANPVQDVLKDVITGGDGNDILVGDFGVYLAGRMRGSRDALLAPTLAPVLDYLCDIRLLFTDLELFIHDIDRVIVTPFLNATMRYGGGPCHAAYVAVADRPVNVYPTVAWRGGATSRSGMIS